MDDFIGAMLLTVFVSLIVFLILRELMCWYWKINKIVSLLEGIQASLCSQNRSPGDSSWSLPELTPDKEICPFCKEPSLKAESVCNVCGKMKR